jgi:hypothetical protein
MIERSSKLFEELLPIRIYVLLVKMTITTIVAMYLSRNTIEAVNFTFIKWYS